MTQRSTLEAFYRMHVRHIGAIPLDNSLFPTSHSVVCICFSDTCVAEFTRCSVAVCWWCNCVVDNVSCAIDRTVHDGRVCLVDFVVLVTPFLSAWSNKYS